jgi:hypothetical protein
MEYDQSDWIMLNNLSSSLDHYKKRYDDGLNYFFCYWCSSRAKMYWRERHRHLVHVQRCRASRCCVLQTEGYGGKRKTTWVASQIVLMGLIISFDGVASTTTIAPEPKWEESSSRHHLQSLHYRLRSSHCLARCVAPTWQACTGAAYASVDLFGAHCVIPAMWQVRGRGRPRGKGRCCGRLARVDCCVGLVRESKPLHY